MVKLIVHGLRRILGDAQDQKLPITPEILLRIRSKLMANRYSGIWAAMLIGLYSFFRKSNLVPKSAKDYDPSKTLSREDIFVRLWGLVICVQWSKTIQFKQRKLLIPVVRLLSNHPLCPVHAYERHLRSFPAPPSLPAFLHFRADHASPITHSVFTAKLRQFLSYAGLKAFNCSGHSFRRGGATFAFHCGAPIELISLQGDWSSDAVLLYIAQPLTHCLSVAHLIMKNIISSST